MSLLTRTQLTHRLRWLSQQVAKPMVAVIGGYHGGNVGDIALGTVCVHYLQQAGISAGLQTVYSLSRWPACRFALLGGGAIGYRTPLQNVRARYGGTPERVAFLGVDFNDDSAVLENAQFLRNVAAITCRSRAQAERTAQLINRSDVGCHPDLAFGLRTFGQETLTKQQRPRTLGVNCTDFFWSKSGNSYVPGWKWEKEIKRRSPHLAPWISELGPLYVNAFGSVLNEARRAGWEIWHVPFKPLDDHFARHFFATFIDRFVRYSSNPHKVLQTFGRFSVFLPTRFHSLVFAMITSTPVIPFCYAEKSEQLCVDLGLHESSRVAALDLKADPQKLAQAWESPVLIGDDKIARAERDVITALQTLGDKIHACI